MPTVADGVTEVFPANRFAVRTVPFEGFPAPLTQRQFYRGGDMGGWFNDFEPMTTSTPSYQFNGVYFNRRRAQNTKRKRKRKLLPVKSAEDFADLDAYAKSDRFYLDMLEAFIQANQRFPGGRTSGRDSTRSGKPIRRAGARQLGRKQGGFLAPRGTTPPPAAPKSLGKPKTPPWQPPKPPKPPKTPRKAANGVPDSPRKVSSVSVPPWLGPSRAVPQVGNRSQDRILDVSGIGKRVPVGGGLTVISRAAENSRKSFFSRAKEILKIGKIEKFVTRGVTAVASRAQILQKIPEKISARAKILEKIPAKNSFPSPLRPRRPTWQPPDPAFFKPPDTFRKFKIDDGQPKAEDLTPLQEPQVPSSTTPRSCSCPDTKPRKPRLKCRQGYFSETAKGINYKTWSTRKCPVSSSVKPRSRRTRRTTTS